MVGGQSYSNFLASYCIITVSLTIISLTIITATTVIKTTGTIYLLNKDYVAYFRSLGRHTCEHDGLQTVFRSFKNCWPLCYVPVSLWGPGAGTRLIVTVEVVRTQV